MILPLQNMQSITFVSKQIYTIVKLNRAQTNEYPLLGNNTKVFTWNLKKLHYFLRTQDYKFHVNSKMERKLPGGPKDPLSFNEFYF